MSQYSSYLQNINEEETLIAENLIADESTSLLMENGITFFTKNQKAMKKFAELDKINHFKQLIYTSAYVKSLTGGDIIFLVRSQTGKIYVKRINLTSKEGVINAYGDEDVIVFTQKKIIGNIEYTIKSYYDKKVCINRVYDNNDKEINIGEFNTTISKDWQVEPKWIHNLGVVPAWICYNKDFVERATQIDYVFSFKKDDFTRTYDTDFFADCKDTKDSFNLANIINTTFKDYVITCEASKPWIVRNGTSQRNMLKTIRVNAQTGKTEEFFRTGEWIEKMANQIRNSKAGADVKVQFTQTTLNMFMESNEKILELFYYVSGYNVKITNATQKTAKETQMNYSRSIQSTIAKNKLNSEQWRNIFIALFLCYKINLADDETYDFHINRNTRIEKNNILDDGIKMIQIGANTPPELLMQLENMSREEAESKFKDNLAWFKKNKYVVAMQETGAVSGVKGASIPNSSGGNADEQ